MYQILRIFDTILYNNKVKCIVKQNNKISTLYIPIDEIKTDIPLIFV